MVCDDSGYDGEVNMHIFPTVTGVGFAILLIGISSFKSLVVNNM